MNAGACTLVADGGAVAVWDAKAGVRRDPTADDWLTATRLIDALDDVGVYWEMVEPGRARATAADAVHDWAGAFREFSRHVQDAALDAEHARWLLEVLQVVFGDREAIRARRPFSFLLCPHSPLVLDRPYTDAYLAAAGWGIPVAVMPMPLMGLTSPAGLLSTIVLGNCEVLATLCLVQAAERGAPFIYAPAFAVMEPRSGRFGGGGPEHALLGAAATEIGRWYGLPVEASAGGTDHHVPGIQAAYERALGWELPVLAWPDLLVGPGVFGAATLALEQVVLDVEVFRRCRRIAAGIGDGPDGATDRIVEMLAAVGPGGEFLAELDTRAASRSGEWYVGRLGVHDGFERWDASGRPDPLVEARERVAALIAAREPTPFDDDTERELATLEARARPAGPAGGRGSSAGRQG